jgi:hypothetical protein
MESLRLAHWFRGLSPHLAARPRLFSAKGMLLLIALILPAVAGSQTLLTPPTGYSSCASEGGVCTFTGTAYVAYGGNGSFVFRTVTGGTNCTQDAFGEEPAPNGANACYIPTVPAGYTFCAAEYGTCSVVGQQPVTVAFDANGKYFYSQTPVSSIGCNIDAFGQGDPLPYVPKNCFVPAVPLLSSPCAVEGQTCFFGRATSGEVAFGANGNYVFRYISNQTATPCDATHLSFGQEPTPGVNQCFLLADVPQAPYGYTWCANEGGFCNFSDNVKVAYGANGNFIFGSFSNGRGVTCSSPTFGKHDPAPYVVKACYIPTVPPGFTLCAYEHNTCSFYNGTAPVAFGANGKFIVMNVTLANGNGIPCENSTFGQDPAYGTPKACYIPAGPPGYAYCSAEGDACPFPNNTYGLMYFGFNGAFTSREFAPPAAGCVRQAFIVDPDPLPGVVKSCFVQPIFVQ